MAAINTAMAGMSYAPTANYNGAATLTILTSDLGNTGAGGPLTDTDTVNITVNAVNDAPARIAGTVSNLTVLEDSGTTLLGLSALAYCPARPMRRVRRSLIPLPPYLQAPWATSFSPMAPRWSLRGRAIRSLSSKGCNSGPPPTPTEGQRSSAGASPITADR